MKRLVMVILSLVMFVSLSACANKASGSQGKSSEVPVNMTSYKFEVAPTPIPSGPVTFHVTNSAGDQQHEMVLIQTDLPSSQLPKDEAGLADEDKLKSMGEVEVEPNATKDLSVNLPAGHYVLLCNEPGHYNHGMAADITVQ